MQTAAIPGVGGLPHVGLLPVQNVMQTVSPPAQARDKAFQERQRAARAAAKVAAAAAEVRRRGAGRSCCSAVPLLALLRSLCSHSFATLLRSHSFALSAHTPSLVRAQAKRRANAEAAAALRAESQLISDFTAVISAGEQGGRGGGAGPHGGDTTGSAERRLSRCLIASHLPPLTRLQTRWQRTGRAR